MAKTTLVHGEDATRKGIASRGGAVLVALFR